MEITHAPKFGDIFYADLIGGEHIQKGIRPVIQTVIPIPMWIMEIIFQLYSLIQKGKLSERLLSIPRMSKGVNNTIGKLLNLDGIRAMLDVRSMENLQGCIDLF